MIYIRRSGSAFTIGNADIGYLTDVACRAMDRGETVELQTVLSPWRPVADPDEVRDVLNELYEELDAHRDALEGHEMLPLDGDAL